MTVLQNCQLTKRLPSRHRGRVHQPALQIEDEDSLPDVAFGARRLAALEVSVVGTTKDEDEM